MGFLRYFYITKKLPSSVFAHCWKGEIIWSTFTLTMGAEERGIWGIEMQ